MKQPKPGVAESLTTAPLALNAEPLVAPAHEHFHAGNVHLHANDWAAAQTCFEQAVAHQPDLAEAHANLAYALDMQGQRDAAISSYLDALALDPDCYQTHLNVGVLLASTQRLDAAMAAYGEAMRCNKNAPGAWSNRGVLLLSCKREAEAEACLTQALALDPTYAKARFNLAYLQLRQGRFEEGWQSFESRDWYASLAQHFNCPRWQGESLTGKSLVVGSESGHGDVIQFCRYVPLLKARGAARLSLICHPALKPLLVNLAGLDDVLALDETIARDGWDYWMPLMSAPLHCQTRAHTIPADIPYLQTDTNLVATWRHLVRARGYFFTKIRIGLVWRGNPKFENDAHRSVPELSTLAPLWSVPAAEFISLQKGAGEDQVQQLPAHQHMLALGPLMNNFADAAAIVSQLDLLISVDTAMAHLAGALGVPCWLMLPDYMADWRWQAQGEHSPWYPLGMRLFRQSQPGDWAGVVQQMLAALPFQPRRQA